MKNAAFISLDYQFPFRCRLRNEIELSRDVDSIDANALEQSIFTGFALQEPFCQLGIDFAMNGAGKFARRPGGTDWTVTVDETQACPHGSAAGPHNLTDRCR